MSHSLLYSPFFSGDRRDSATADGRRARDLLSASDAAQAARDARLLTLRKQAEGDRTRRDATVPESQLV